MSSAVCNPLKKTAPGQSDYMSYDVKSTMTEHSTGDGQDVEYIVHKRFNDFVALYNELTRAYATEKVVVPSLPAGQSIGRFNKSFIQSRMEKLTTFLNKLHSHLVISNSPIFRAFLLDEHLALVYRSFGGLEKLELLQLPLPKLVLQTDVLVRVHAASLNPADLKHRNGELKYLVKRDFPIGIGFDFSGEVVAMAEGVEGFSVGDSVYGDVLGLRTGTVAQYVVVDSRIMKHKPSNLSHVQAAGAPLAGMTALQCFSTTELKPGGAVLVTGGAGGVGSYAIQLARQLYQSALIVTTASPGTKTDFCIELGADRVLNYRDNFVKTCEEEGMLFDCIMDCTGEGHKLVGLVKPRGGLVSILTQATGDMLNTWVAGSIVPGVSISPLITGSVRALGTTLDVFTGATRLQSRLKKEGGRYKFVITMPSKEMMATLSHMLETGAVKPYIDSEWDLVNALQGVKVLESGHAMGKVVIKCV